MTNTKTLLTLGLISAAKAFLAGGERGVIDMDVHVTERPHRHHSGLASHLMNLSQVDGSKDYIEKNLDNFFNIQIYANILIGSNRQKFPLIFDSGSSWVWVGHDLCNTCANKSKLDSNSSTTFT